VLYLIGGVPPINVLKILMMGQSRWPLQNKKEKKRVGKHTHE
jgi:hypothetical protein